MIDTYLSYQNKDTHLERECLNMARYRLHVAGPSTECIMGTSVQRKHHLACYVIDLIRPSSSSHPRT